LVHKWLLLIVKDKPIMLSLNSYPHLIGSTIHSPHSHSHSYYYYYY
jgi:hypothetical protein